MAADETFKSGGKDLRWDVRAPAGPGRRPAVLILHGSFGMLPQFKADIESFGDDLLARGIASALPYYLQSTGTEPGMGVLSLIRANRPAWRQAAADALTAMTTDARFDRSRLGILGFSLGGNLALSLALNPPSGATVKAVVDFFGPTAELETNLASMPPLQLFHGGADPLVDIGQSRQLVVDLEKAGKKQGRDLFVEFDAYAKESHGFKGEKLTSSRKATIDFFNRTL